MGGINRYTILELLFVPEFHTALIYICEPGSSVSIVSGYGLHDRAN
jgi:hypothetical protein